MKKLLIFVLITFSSTCFGDEFSMSCSRKYDTHSAAQFDMYFIGFKRGQYQISTISVENEARISSFDPIENLEILRVSKQRSKRDFDDVFEVAREFKKEMRFFRFIMDNNVSNLLVAQEEEEVLMERHDGSLTVYACKYID
jgi:hypothetical protein